MSGIPSGRSARPPRRTEATIIHANVGRGKGDALLVTVCGGDVDEPTDCVVKLDAKLQMPPTEHLKEWLGAELGRHLGVTTPEPFEVTIPSALAETVEGFTLRSWIRDATRPVFGSRLVTGLTPPIPSESLPVEIRLAAAELIAFDVFIHNYDRRLTNPNVLIDRTRLVAFDHGDAFAFLLPLPGGRRPGA